jgi:hypothetical protein
MANHSGGLEAFLDFTSTPAWRSAIFSAAASFAAFDVIAKLTPPLLLDDLGQATDLAPQLLHMAAVLLRFVLPVACLCAGARAFFRHKRRVC